MGSAKCTGCKLCVRDCPSNAIELEVVDKATKRFVLRYHTDRCTFCAQCVVNCNFDCLGLSHEQWELAALSKQPFIVSYGRDEDIHLLAERERAKAANAGPSPA